MIIWSTRGRDWGHRFIRRGGSADPLVDRDRAFEGADVGREVCHRNGKTLALRFMDPEGRLDAAGRPIVHELVVEGPESVSVTSLEEGISEFWPGLAEEYSRIYDGSGPSSTSG